MYSFYLFLNSEKMSIQYSKYECYFVSFDLILEFNNLIFFCFVYTDFNI